MENTFDFVINEEDEVMLLIYARDGAPSNPFIEISPEDKTAILHRNDNDEILLENIDDEVIDSLHDADTLLVCELSADADNEDTKIVNAYEVDISM